MLKWAVENSLSFEVKKADKQRWIAACRTPDICSFRARINVSKKLSEAKLTVLESHTCPAVTHYGWRAANSVKVLALSVAAVVDDCKIKPKQIQTIERLQRGHKIKYQQAYRTEKKIHNDVYGSEAESFQLIPSMLQAMKGDDNYCEHDLEIDELGRFDRC